ncbi:alcohol dehydrogenase catalytic domain-containing protein [Cognatishimia activa]|uniref:Sorbitol dehydrogenase n=1 Tax=Cognatishimia activa TaxID=1715691 RepID=A0A0P1IQV6_9RHOB|nr:alcohol dehydrogenase catalytic domain-containing protein [Cognatishimia activa]CUJ07891.1 Sorbitol dehydrogenase [Cognatishimia activa]CUK25962.1 Sorbitol dehydrogenase [Cognatishimia activa]
MKALVYEGVERLEMRDVPVPTVKDGEHLVRIHAVGICGSDIHAYLGHDERRPAPLTLGHEAAGVVEDGPWKGRRVTINPLVTCGTCSYCRSGRTNLCPDRQIISMPPREGAFAQFVSMPESNLIPVPDSFSLEKAALAEPISVSWHAARVALEALHPSMDRQALVIGGGAIGLAATLALTAMGITEIQISEPNAQRRAYLRNQYGLDAHEAPTKSAPIVIDAVGFNATRAAASELAQPGGVIVHVGLGDNDGGLDIRRLTLQEISFIGTYTYTEQDFRDATQAMFDGRLGALDWLETRALEDGSTAFKDMRAGRSAAPKIILTPWGPPSQT